MTGAMQGADVSELIVLRDLMDAKARQLEQMRSQLRGRLYASTWRGRDSQAFRAEWESSLSPVLARSAADLRASALRLTREAEDQRRASEGSGLASFGSYRRTLLPGNSIGRASDGPTLKDALGVLGLLNGTVNTVEGVLTVGAAALWAGSRKSIDEVSRMSKQAFQAFVDSKAPKIIAKGPLRKALGPVGDLYSMVMGVREADSWSFASGAIGLILFGGAAVALVAGAPVLAGGLVVAGVLWGVVSVTVDAYRVLKEPLTSVTRSLIDGARRKLDVVLPKLTPPLASMIIPAAVEALRRVADPGKFARFIPGF